MGKPCRECPFRREAAPGYLGAATFEPDPPNSFLDQHWNGFTHLPCHMQVNWEQDDSQREAQEKPTCTGYAIMCKNSAKLPMNPIDAEVVRDTEPDHDNVFSNRQEWDEHHRSMKF